MVKTQEGCSLQCPVAGTGGVLHCRRICTSKVNVFEASILLVITQASSKQNHLDN